MYNPLSAGRRHAQRTAIFGLVATGLVALATFAATRDVAAAQAALSGGLGIVIGSWVGAWISLGRGQVQGAGTAFARLVMGLGIKWVLAFAAMLFSIAQGWPPLPLLIAVIVAILAPLTAELYFNLRNSR